MYHTVLPAKGCKAELTCVLYTHTHTYMKSIYIAPKTGYNRATLLCAKDPSYAYSVFTTNFLKSITVTQTKV